MSLEAELRERASRVRRDVEIMRPYQTDELVPFLLENPFSAGYVDLGLGKTVSVLTVLAKLFERGEINKVLIIGPLRVIIQTWPTEITEWSHTWPMSYTVIRSDPHHPGIKKAQAMARAIEREDDLGSPMHAARRAKTLHMEQQKKRLATKGTMIHLINREAVEWLVKGFGKQWPYDCVIIDESTSFADHNTKRWIALNSVRPFIKRLHLLSGVPAPEGISDYFAQVYLLDKGERLGRFITHFRNQYLDHDEYSRKYTPKPGANEEVAEAIADICLVMRSEDYLPREKAIVIERPIVLERHELDLYKQFERDLILQLPEVEIEADNGAALAQKLIQMASGAVYDNDGKYHHIHDHKLEELQQIVEEAPGEPLLIAYWHKPSLARIRKLFPDAVVMDRDGACVPDWNAGKIDKLLIHPRSAGHGLNMQLGPGRTLIWFDNPLPLEDYLQTIGRLDRSGQKQLVKVFHLVTQKTIDATVVPRLRDKDNAQDAVRQYIRDLRRAWRKNNGIRLSGRPG